MFLDQDVGYLKSRFCITKSKSVITFLRKCIDTFLIVYYNRPTETVNRHLNASEMPSGTLRRLKSERKRYEGNSGRFRYYKRS